MFICICNALKEAQMHCAIEQGASNAQEIYASLGCQPKCGRCIPFVEEHLLAQRTPPAHCPIA